MFLGWKKILTLRVVRGSSPLKNDLYFKTDTVITKMAELLNPCQTITLDPGSDKIINSRSFISWTIMSHESVCFELETSLRTRKLPPPRQTLLHTVSFDWFWFMSNIEWILKFWYFHYGVSDLGLTIPYFELLVLYFNMCKKLQFWSHISKYMPENLKMSKS